MEIILNDANEIIEPDVHDGYLTGILSKDKTSQLEITTYHKETVSLFLHDVKNIQVEDFAPISIILDINISKLTESAIQDDWIKREIQHIYPLYNADSLNKIIEKMILEKAILICVYP